jgi:polysaccharide export outer membrane protein
MLLGALLASLLVTACRTAGPFVWVDVYKPSAAPVANYLIAAGDLLNVRVWNQDAMSAKVRVRTDGNISLPFVNDVAAVGLEPTALARRLQLRLKEFIVNPEVTVSLEEEAPLEVSAVGEVAHPGVFKLERNVLLVKLLATAGGLTEMAHRDGIYVLRYGEGQDVKTPVRIRFKYEDLLQARGSAGTFRLRPGDVVVVE